MYLCVYKITVWAWTMSVMGLIRTASICHSNLRWAATERERESIFLSFSLALSLSLSLALSVSLSLFLLYEDLCFSLLMCGCVCVNSLSHPPIVSPLSTNIDAITNQKREGAPSSYLGEGGIKLPPKLAAN
jgi:hypothetical protein